MRQKSPVPVPLSATLCGLPGALSVKLSVAVRDALATGPQTGLKMIWIVHVPAAGIPFAAAVPIQLFVWLKSLAFAPETEIAFITRGPLPEFVTVTLTAELAVPTA